MKITRFALISLICGLLAAFAVASLQAQSLADLARKQRAKTGQQPKSGKVFTNDDIAPPQMNGTPAATTEEGTTAAPAEGASAGTPEGADKGGTETGTPASTAAPKPAAEPEKTSADLEKEYREKFGKLRDEQALAERKLDVLQRELNLKQTQYYGDPNQTLMQETFRTDINKWTAEIDAQKAAVEASKQAIANLEEELRKKGLPPGWSR